MSTSPSGRAAIGVLDGVGRALLDREGPLLALQRAEAVRLGNLAGPLVNDGKVLEVARNRQAKQNGGRGFHALTRKLEIASSSVLKILNR